MLNNIPIFIGLRYIRAKRRNQFISFVSGFSLLGMILGTMALVIVLSVMNGFDREIKSRILSVIPHGFIDKSPSLDNWQALSTTVAKHPAVLASAPYVAGYGMLVNHRATRGIDIRGVMINDNSGNTSSSKSGNNSNNVSAIEDYMVVGKLTDLHPGEFGIVLGRLTANYLSVTVGSDIILTLPQVSITPAGIFPRVKQLTVVGIFEVGAQVDQHLAIMNIEDTQRLFRFGNTVQGLELKLTDIYHAGEVTKALAEQLGDAYQVRDWSQTQGSLFAAIKMEKRIITLLLMIIIAVAALNIVTSLVLMVADKRSDIAVLRTIGLSAGGVMKIFIVQGSAVGITGIIIGSILGSIIAVNIGDIVLLLEKSLGIYLFDPSVYFINRLPSELRLSDMAVICTVGAILSILATLYPAYRAAQVEPAEVLRYE